MEELAGMLLSELRGRIDSLDRSIVRLLEERMQVVTRISDVKKKYGVAVLDANREKLVLDNVIGAIENHEMDDYMIRMFESIMEISREYQKSRISTAQAAEAPDRPESARFGLLGGKLSHSLSPQIHQALFRLNGIDGAYELLERRPEELAELLPALRAQGYRGINVTIPYKTDIMKHLHALSPEAVHIGAVNTVLLGERFVGHNTDYAGFGDALRHHLPSVAGMKAAVLGTGGSSRAVLAWLEDNGIAEITLVSRDPESANDRFPGLPAVATADFRAQEGSLVVNCTPVGMHPNPDASPIGPEQLRGAAFVCDLIYNPARTLLMRHADALGIPCANGLGMLVAQAFAAESLWWGGRAFPAGQIETVEREIAAHLEQGAPR